MRFIAICLLFLSFSSSAFADQTRTLEKQIQTSLDRFQRNLALHGVTAHLEGGLIIEKADTYYAITLPDISIDYPGQSHLDVGIISINALPSKDKDVWRMRVALPTPMRITNALKGESFNIHLATQNIEAFWHGKTDLITALHADLQNIRLEDPASGQQITVGNSNFNHGITDPDLSKFAEYRKAQDKWLERAKKSSSALTEDDLKTAESLFNFYVGDYAQSQETSLKLSNVQIKDGVKTRLNISDIDVLASIKSVEGGLLDVLSHTDMKGIAVAQSPTPSTEKSSLPSYAKSTLHLTKLPKSETLSFLKENAMNNLALAIFLNNPSTTAEQLKKQAQTSQQARKKMFEKLDAFKTALAKTGSQAALSFETGTADDYALSLNMALQGDEIAKQKGTGEIKISLQGYDKFKETSIIESKALQDKMKQENPQSPAVNLPPEMLFSILETVGQYNMGENGKSSLDIIAALNQEGKLSLNGQDVKAYMALVLPVFMLMSQQFSIQQEQAEAEQAETGAASPENSATPAQ